MSDKPTHSHLPKSSVIERIDWHDGEIPTMLVKLSSGKEYTYYNVPPDDYQAFIMAESVGSHYGKHVKGRYRKPEDEV